MRWRPKDSTRTLTTGKIRKFAGKEMPSELIPTALAVTGAELSGPPFNVLCAILFFATSTSAWMDAVRGARAPGERVHDD